MSVAGACARLVAVAVCAVSLALPAFAEKSSNTCLECHRTLDDPKLVAPTRHFAQDIHAVRGLGCVGCHGGDPSDPEITAMDPDKGYRGVPTRAKIADMCASCHADAEVMKRYNPQPYVFSLSEFHTSVHYKRLMAGDQKAATCTSCHGLHGILPHKDPASPVYITNVPETCGKCHNATYMKGRSLPTDQHDKFVNSVHGKALLVKGDLSAPACNSCHGNHGAVPPNTRDISVVCSNCHGREGELFAKSKVSTTLQIEGKRGCVTCHSNHDVRHPTDAMISVGKNGLCNRCHEPNSPGARASVRIIAQFDSLQTGIRGTDSLLALADIRGMDSSQGRIYLKQASDQLVNLRVALHSFDEKLIMGVLKEGRDNVDKAQGEALAALHDYRSRRLGTASSVGVILILMAFLVMKIRQAGPPRP